MGRSDRRRGLQAGCALECSRKLLCPCDGGLLITSMAETPHGNWQRRVYCMASFAALFPTRIHHSHSNLLHCPPPVLTTPTPIPPQEMSKVWGKGDYVQTIHPGAGVISGREQVSRAPQKTRVSPGRHQGVSKASARRHQGFQSE